MMKIFDQEAASAKEARRFCRLAYATGGTVPYSLRRLIELKLRLKVIKAIYRGKE
jgi:hypothetical protein